MMVPGFTPPEYVKEPYVQSQYKVRRLYCLECGEGAFNWLPCDWHVAQHKARHKWEDDDASHFVVVDRGDDRSIELLQNLDKMMVDPAFVWEGALADAMAAEDEEEEAVVVEEEQPEPEEEPPSAGTMRVHHW